jgi:hypothetical protein
MEITPVPTHYVSKKYRRPKLKYVNNARDVAREKCELDSIAIFWLLFLGKERLLPIQ